MKRKLMISVNYVLLYELPVLWILVILCVVQTVDSQQDPLECPEVTYLELGKEGIISCGFENFYSVSWFTKGDYDDKQSPFLHFNGNKHGNVDEYDVHPNGSLIFRNVSLNDAGAYTVTMLKDITSNLLVKEVHLKVYVIPDPIYPVVEGYTSQQHVYMDVSRNGELSCSVRGVYPNISLMWTIVDRSQMGKIQFHQDVVGRRNNNDGTYDITLTSLYSVTDQSVRRITIQCGVADEMGEVLSSKTKVELLFTSVYPVVNGYVNQNRVYLDVDRIGHLSCLKENVDPDTRLEWALDSTLKGKVTFHSRAVTVINPDGTVNINQTFDYVVHDNFLERVTIECRVIKPGILEHPIATTVDLLFSSACDAICHPTTGYVIGSMLMLVVIIFLLLIVLFLYFKMYKNILVKLNHCTVDRPTDNAQVEVQNNQSDSPDSGNSHSNSQQLNEDESSEQHAFLDDGWLDSKKQDPSDVNLRAIAFGDAQVV